MRDNEDLKIIISNTTEVGIQLVKDDIRKHPPVSFPGKLLAFLYERFTAFKGREDSGFVIVPTELILENGKKLESIVLNWPISIRWKMNLSSGWKTAIIFAIHWSIEL